MSDRFRNHAPRVAMRLERAEHGPVDGGSDARGYDVMLTVLRDVRGTLAQIEKHDADLARQMRRAGASAVLNIAEGSGSSGGVRRMRYRTALGSVRETRACIDAAQALGYVARADERVRAGLLHVSNVLVRVTA